MVDRKRYHNAEIGWKHFQRAKVSFILHCLVREELVDKDVNQLSGGEYHKHACQRSVTCSRILDVTACLSKACCQWSHARSKSLLLVFTELGLYHFYYVNLKVYDRSPKSCLYLPGSKCLKMYYRRCDKFSILPIPVICKS